MPEDLEEYLRDQKARGEEQDALERVLSTGAYCYLCGFSSDPMNIQMHHVAGRKHGDLVIPLCLDCHGTLSRKQRHWPAQWLQEGLSSRLRTALMLRGMSEVLALISTFLRQISDRIIQEEGR